MRKISWVESVPERQLRLHGRSPEPPPNHGGAPLKLG